MQILSTARRRATLVAVVATGALVLAGCAPSDSPASDGTIDPVSLTLTMYAGPTAPLSLTLQDAIDTIAADSDGAVEIEPFWSGSLVPAPEGLAAASDGRADIAVVSAAYTPAEMPLSQLLGVPFLAPDSATGSEALAALYESDPAFQNEFAANGVHLLAVVLPGENIIATNEPISGPDDLEGQSIRATGALGTALQGLGVNVQSLAATELYESLERGLITGYSSFAYENILGFGLGEVATNITDPGTGPYIASYVVVSSAVWDGLSDAQRAVISDSLSTLPILEKSREFTSDLNSQICDALLAAGGSVTVWDEDTVADFKDEIGSGLVDQWKATAGADADAFYTAFEDAIAGVDGERRQTGVAECAAR